MESIDFAQVKQMLRDFAHERDWEKFHNPKNLSMALAVEAAELLEIFQWLDKEEIDKLQGDSQLVESVAHELADILLYATRVADILHINLKQALEQKHQLNIQKYPPDKVRGSAKKLV